MSWKIKMGWHNVLFLHWKVPPDVLQQYMPKTLELDLFDHQAWIGIVAFEMNHVRRRWVPPLPGMRSFPELNVRTYCQHGDKKGIFFLSLDTPEWFTRTFGKRGFHLPYRKRQIDYQATANCPTLYRSYNPDGTLEFATRYEPAAADAAAISAAASPDFMHWSSERYSLFSENRKGILMRGDVHHRSWCTSQVAFELTANNLLAPFIEPTTNPDAAHYSAGVDTFAQGLVKI